MENDVNGIKKRVDKGGRFDMFFYIKGNCINLERG
jgi:hypothetical protein